MEKQASGLIINNDIDEFNRYKLERSKILRQKSLEAKVEKLETELSELKNILQSLQSRIG